METHIYALIDPRTNLVRYIGKSHRHLKRFAELCLARDKECSPYRIRWIKALAAEGLKPRMALLEATTEEDWPERETFWIAFCRALGMPLTNLTAGGEGVKMTPEIRAKIGDANRGRETWRGRRHSEETRAKLSALRKGKATRKGFSLSPEHKEKIAAAHRGKPRSPETVEKVAAALRGRPLSPEHRAKIAAAVKAYRATAT